MLNVNKIKQDFPVFRNNPDLVYLDSTNTALTLAPVVDKLVEYYTQYPANIRRGIYEMSEQATEAYESTREAVSRFINAKAVSEVIFTSGTTDSINLVAYALGRKIVEEGSEIVTTVMEHHSNFVPWQQLAFETGADFKVIDIDEKGELSLNNIQGKEKREKGKVKLDDIITKRTRVLAITYISNVLGTVNPIKEIVEAARKINPDIAIVLDAAQAAPHVPIDVQALGVDFVAFSFHKMFGPKGVGVLWGRGKLLDSMFPYKYGGEMIREVAIEKTIFADLPHKFEAGTPPIADVIAAHPAIEYVENLGWGKLREHEQALRTYAHDALQNAFDGMITLYGPPNGAAVISFSLNGVHPHDLAQVLNDSNIAIRAGHHCAMPLHKRLGVIASARASFSIYNDKRDIDKLVTGLEKAKTLLSR